MLCLQSMVRTDFLYVLRAANADICDCVLLTDVSRTCLQCYISSFVRVYICIFLYSTVEFTDMLKFSVCVGDNIAIQIYLLDVMICTFAAVKLHMFVQTLQLLRHIQEFGMCLTSKVITCVNLIGICVCCCTYIFQYPWIYVCCCVITPLGA